jgi:hypothetical protein
MMEDELVPAVRAMTKGEIDQFSLSFMYQHFPELLAVPGKLNVFDLLEELRDFYRIDYAVDVLEPGIDAVVHPNGDMEIDERTYAAATRDDPRARRTLTHEACHVVLHAPQVQRAIVHRTGALYRRSEIPNMISPEWQADCFADAAMMPRPSVHRLVEWRGPKEAIRFGAEVFGVSEQAMMRRIVDLTRLRNK